MNKMISFIFVLGMSFNAFSSGNPIPQDPARQTLTFEQFRESCKDPRRFQNQRPPLNIKVICSDTKTLWVPRDISTVAIDSFRKVKTELLSDKYHVRPQENWVPSIAVNVDCPVLKEEVRTLTTEHEITCKDVENSEITLLSFCKGQLDSTISTNGDLVEIRRTGRDLAICGNQRTDQTGQQQGGQAPKVSGGCSSQGGCSGGQGQGQGQQGPGQGGGCPSQGGGCSGQGQGQGGCSGGQGQGQGQC